MCPTSTRNMSCTRRVQVPFAAFADRFTVKVWFTLSAPSLMFSLLRRNAVPSGATRSMRRSPR